MSIGKFCFLFLFSTEFIVIVGPCISESKPFVIVQNSIPFDANKVLLCYTVSIHVIGCIVRDCERDTGANSSVNEEPWPPATLIIHPIIVCTCIRFTPVLPKHIFPWIVVIFKILHDRIHVHCNIHLHCIVQSGFAELHGPTTMMTKSFKKTNKKKVQNLPILIPIPISQNYFYIYQPKHVFFFNS